MRAHLIVAGAAMNVAVTASAGVPTPVLLWSNGGCPVAYCQNAWYSSPAVYDIDGDGIADVVSASYDAVVLDASTGATKHRAANLNRVWGDVAIADLAGDGHPSAILARSDGNVFVYDDALSARAGWPVKPFTSGEVRALAIANLDGNGKLQVVAGVASGVTIGQVDVYESSGAHRPGWPRLQSGDGYGYGIYNDNLAAADLTHAGHDEIIVGSDTPFLMGLNPDGSGIPAAQSFGSNLPWAKVHAWIDPATEIVGYADCSSPVLHAWFTFSAAAVGDVNGDGMPEIAIVGNIVDCSTFTDQYYLPWLLLADRSRFVASGADWTTLPAPGVGSAPLSEANSVIYDAMPNTVLADLDGDGKLEILYASYDGKVHAYWLDKTEHGSWPFAIPGSGIHFASPPVVADLYHDGNVEVLFTTWPQFATSETGKLYMLDHTGTVMASIDLPAPAGGGWNGGLASPTLAWLPGNRDINVVINTWATGVVAYQLPGTAYGRTRWATGRGSYRRNGVAFNDRIYADGAGG